MLKLILFVLRQFAGSKKAVAGTVSTLAAVGAKLGLPEPEATMVSDTVVKVGIAYVLGQGLADLGKEKAKVEVA